MKDTTSSRRRGDTPPRDVAIDEELVLGQVAEEINACLGEGKTPDIDALVAAHPQLAKQITEFVPALMMLHDWGHDISHAEGTGPSRTKELHLARQLGDYRIIREAGRGGMGVVYEAEQVSLGRRVALKVLPFAAVLDNRQLQRFKNEAMAAAQLDHGNILSVYSVGCERGVHFYAMRFIDGPTLADVVQALKQAEADQDGSLKRSREQGATKVGSDASLQSASRKPQPAIDSRTPQSEPRTQATGSSAMVLHSSRSEGWGTGSSAVATLTSDGSTKSLQYFQAVARLGIQAAEALDHAHAHGIVHRDIKPSNLLLDGDGTLWVTDFGLAQCQTDTGVSLTQPGDLLGTLRYMSPEQALAKRVPMDHRTDIYSLGVTLYEMLTLTPAITGQDRHELLRKIADEEPTAPRRLNQALPADLETIILKASAKDAPDRYATAQAFADDLRRFLEHKPILAKRPTGIERAGKWARRHRGVLGTAVAVLLVASAVAGALLLQAQGRTSDALAVAREQRDEAEAQRVRAEDSLRTARRAVEDMYTEVAEKWLANQPQMTTLQRQFLEKALGFYQQFAETDSADDAMRVDAATAYSRVGEIELKLGHHEEAEAAFRKAIALQKQFDTDTSEGEALQQDALSLSYMQLGRVLEATGRLEEALDLYAEALALREKLVAASPEPASRAELGAIRNRLGSAYVERLETWDRAEEEFRQAIAIQKKLTEEFPAEPKYRINLMRSRMDLGKDVRNETEVQLEQAIKLGEGLVGEFPDVPEYRSLLAEAHNFVGIVFAKTGEPARAEQPLRRAMELRAELHKQFPDRPGYESLLAESHNNLALVFSLQGRKAESDEMLRKARDLRAALAFQHPDVPHYRFAVAESEHNLGALADTAGRQPEAEDAYRRAISIYKKLANEFPDQVKYRWQLNRSQSALAGVLSRTGRPADAEAMYRAVLAVYASLAHDFPEVANYQDQWARSHRNLAGVLGDLNRQDDAVLALERAIEIHVTLAADPSESAASYRAWVASDYDYLGKVLHGMGRREKAGDAFRQVVIGYESLLEELPDELSIRRNLAWFFVTCPDVQFRDPDRAVAVATECVEKGPDAWLHWTMLGVAQYRAGDRDAAKTSFETAVDLQTGAATEIADQGKQAEAAISGFVLAMVHWQNGDKAEARQAYTDAQRWLDKARPGYDGSFNEFYTEAAALLGVKIEASGKEAATQD